LKKLSLDKFLILSLILTALVTTLVFLCGCTTTVASSNEDEQIIKTAIELATEYCNRKQFENALDVYDKALQEVHDYRLIFNKALVLSYMGQIEDAILLCESGYNEYPYILSFKKAQAQYYVKLGALDQSCNVYLGILELNPYDTETRKALIEIYTQNNDNEKAYEQLQILWDQGYKDLEIITKFLQKSLTEL